MNPTGRLPYTIARRESDYGHLLNASVALDDVYFPEDNFTEGLFLDYRAFDRDGVDVRFEFGFGLGYTTFEYDKDHGLDVHVEEEIVREWPDPEVSVVQGGHPQLWDVVAKVRCFVRNTGEVSGAEIAQLYVGVPPPEGSDEDEDKETPIRTLRGFEKIGPLEPGEKGYAIFELTRRDLSVWDVERQQWRLRRGTYKLWVGASSRDLRVSGRLDIIE